MEFFDTIRQVKSNWKPYKKWDFEQQKKEKQNEELRKKYPPNAEELERAKQYGRTIVDVINTMDQHSIDKSEDAALIVKNSLLGLGLVGMGIGAGLGASTKFIPGFNKKIKLPTFIVGALGALIGESISLMIGEIWGAQVEKQASRIARYQTREVDLRDSRYFVIYNKKQIEEAQKIAKTLPEIEEKRKDLSIKKSMNPFASLFKAKQTTDSLAKDYKTYKQWQREYLKQEALKPSKFSNMHPTQSELSKAEKDRDAILSTIKKVENSSLNYFMNMKLALCTMMILIDGSALAVGFGIHSLIEKLQKHKILKPESSALNAIKIGSMKFLPMIVGIIAIGPTVKLIKDAARIGRFKAKQEILANPQNFITYDDNQRKTVETPNIKEAKPKGFFEKLKQDLKDVKQLKQDSKDYHNYMNTKHKEELKLDEALKQIQISDAQKADAVQLQKKAFHSFEKIDEKAQRFTDDTDAAVDATKLSILTVLACTCNIILFTLFYKKFKELNHGIEPTAKDMKNSFKHFKGADLVKMVGVSLIPTIMHIPMIIKGIQIKKEAGKIGVMKAMQDLDDPKNFLDEENEKN